MKNALYLLFAFGYHILFVVLEIICFYLIVKTNSESGAIFNNTTSIFTQTISKKADQVENYLSLAKVNDSLTVENAKLMSKLLKLQIYTQESNIDSIILDSIQYELIPSLICNHTLHLTNNTITLCKGSKNGIEPDMGVITQNGIVGQIKKTSEDYSLVLSLLNNQTNISCAIKRDWSHGTLKWRGHDPRIMNLEDIPKHRTIVVGDTVVTSGYSTIFPKNIMVGIVKAVRLEHGSNSHTIDVQLTCDPSNIDQVYVIKNYKAQQQKLLESTQ